MPDNEMEELLEKSASTDPKVALTLKENAKRAVLEDPTNPVKIAAFERASKLVESVMQTKANLKDYRAVLDYAEECGRKLGKTKLFEDINKGRLKKQADGTFKQRDVDRYMASLKMAGTGDAVAERAADRQRRKEEADIRKAEASAKREEFDLAVKMGKFVPRDQVHAELAARAVTLSTGIKTAFEAKSLDIVSIVDGNPKKASSLIEYLETLLDEAFNEYSREMEFEVVFVDEEPPASEKRENE